MTLRDSRIEKFNNFKLTILNKFIEEKLTNLNPGISLCSRSMNRNFHLEETIPTWLSIPNINEIIIVDWSSDVPVKSIVDKYQSDKIIVIRVDNNKYFDNCVTRNIGARFASSEYLFMVDADIKINPNVMNDIVLDKNTFYTGTFKENKNDIENQYSTCGQCIISKEMFYKLNGYDENMGNGGQEDSEFYHRLLKSGYNWNCYFLVEYLEAIPHDTNLRLQNYSEKDYYTYNKLAFDYIRNKKHNTNTKMKKVEVKIYYQSEIKNTVI